MKKLLALVALLSLVVGLVGCGSGDQSTPPPAPATNAPAATP
ncbi:MAG TPA: hypothetical protein P5038_21415 [Candidatus Paceibacterota bacterium]|nr:hypothetical protein [Candidatus Paceibacterota bacterium]HRT59196.1 hypothetical protein [Candidatus Paceibacterota bacterium]